MGRFPRAMLCALLSCSSMAWADTLPLAIPAPIPTLDFRLPSLPDMQPARFEPSEAIAAQATSSNHVTQIGAQADLSAFGIPCAKKVTVNSAADAMLDMRISAPCAPGQIVRVSYVGIGFDVTLSMTGEAETRIPAWAYQGEIDSVFEDGIALKSPVLVPSLSAFARVAVGWDHAGDAYIADKAPRHLPVNVITLGDGSGRVAQVVSHHIDPDAKPGVIRLSMIAPVTQENCDQPRMGHVMSHMPGQPSHRYDLTLAAAGCERVGTNLELNNILQDLKLASN